VVRVSELFEWASVEIRGPVPWGTAVAETASGVYVITLADPASVSVEHLCEAELRRWNTGQEIIYIGRATRIRRRVGQFYRHEQGRPSPHRGGQAIKLLDAPMQVYWGVTTNSPLAERTMIDAFQTKVG
jgi:hypothetical protein